MWLIARLILFERINSSFDELVFGATVTIH